jgi:hypothetical protein
MFSLKETVVLADESATDNNIDLNVIPPEFSSLISTHQPLLHDSRP